jgi:hypothetical protein
MHLRAPCLFLLALAACGDSSSTSSSSGSASGGASSTSSSGGASSASSGGASSSGASSSGTSGASGDAGGGDGGGGDGGATYRAVNLVTGVPRYAIVKRDDAAKTCIRMRVEMVGDGDGIGLTVTPQGWAANTVELTNDPTDCDAPGAPAKGVVSKASAGAGGVAFLTGAPCKTSVDATVTFASGAEVMSASDLVIEGGCP